MPAPRPTPDVYLALGDATRRAILTHLATGPCSVLELVGKLPVKQSTVSEHLAVLRSVDLVRVERAGRRRIYRLDTQTLGEAERWLSRLRRARVSPLPRAKTSVPVSKPVEDVRPTTPQQDDWAVWS